MTNTATILITLTALAAFVVVVRVVGRIVSWRITLTALAIAVLVALGLLDTGPVLAELDHLVTNLFGVPS